MKIKNIYPHKILNSAGSWTLETKLELQDGSTGISSVAGGLSKGANECANVQIDAAIRNINQLEEELTGMEFKSQQQFDEFLMAKDGTFDKSNLGGNTILSLSISFCKASAQAMKLESYEYIHTLLRPEIPLNDIQFKIPDMQILIFEGGLHGSGKATIQEFMAVVSDINRATEIYTSVKKSLHNKGLSTNVGAEGAFSPESMDNFEVLDFLKDHLNDNEQIALDVAANSFEELNQPLPDYERIVSNYPIISIEDPYTEKAWTEWENFYRDYRADISVIGDDLTTTNPQILQEAIRREAANGVIVKPNQIGTISETLEFIRIAQDHGWVIISSHRGTDTNDDFIADLAVGSQANFTKFGAPARGERIAKYNRLIRISESLS